MQATLEKRGRGRPRKIPGAEYLTDFFNLDAPETPTPPEKKTPAPNDPHNAHTPLDKFRDVLTTADIMNYTGYGQGAISDLKSQGVILALSTGRWAAVDTLSRMVKRLRARQANYGDEDKRRKGKADADTAEIKAITAAGETCLLSDAKQFWSDSRIDVRRTIERAEYIPRDAREKLLKEIAALKAQPLKSSASQESLDPAKNLAPEETE